MTEKVSMGPLSGTLWLGTAGAALMVGGIAALLAANWHTVPFAAQVAVALAPLLVAWVGYGCYVRRRGAPNLGVEEVLGTIWTGGVVCSVALLGRVLQLASDTFAFCATMAVLLLPVVYALRSTVAWVACAGFALMAAITVGTVLPAFFGEEGWRLIITLASIVAVAPRLAWAWRREGAYACGQRWLGAVGAVLSAWLLGVSASQCLCERFHLDAWALPMLLVGVSWPLLAGAAAERKQGPGGQPLCLLGALSLCWAVLFLLAFLPEWSGGAYPPASGWTALALLLAVVVVGRWVLHGEGLFLLLLPVVALSSWLSWQLPGLGMALGVGAAVIAVGVCTGRRSLANEGLLFVLAAGCVAFGTLKTGLMAQGVLLLLGGMGLVALNVALARFAKGGRHA